jgi:aspartyl protease family protein
MRSYLFFIVALGMFSAIAGHRPSGRSSVREVPQESLVGESESARIAELKAENAPQFSNQDGSIELQRQDDGHFYADVRVNGTYIHMLVDTGASAIALSREDAQSAGIATSIGMNDVIGEGADGAIHGEYAQLDRVELGPLSAERMPAAILNSGQQSLLGQSFLSKFASVQIEGDRMVLR